ncbi:MULTISPECIES: LuxR C-terminal-related transcriptional regulator [unclassified Pseudomonas]|uniref:helix-turn-helix transcriptional regulator n=1 Tax=unclassified Pseudomonas TaxID=196821 RepID=UPI002ACB0DDD|nr:MULTISPECIES: LuxR C-terminal-related transcriptional regulator [unclassified Pseudomonas]MEB0043497.1 LuxR C-terminal-related transcriptional regulator [Pseudomonas sp. MH10]MEB0091015.1 LuxR C-terminal-related transcriptional regulator [Pseudomonas sp. CCI4.2]MEB0121830.1 LuxR C-terminal-related transcriptional regulator [Pseudomonas sp. CCI1.2]WPX55825.1 LuxR C-terminal-related transcriptional regulator [Pseudomonas sp. CCI4.2]WPX63269.1 LuxR C-terminal-related transcriptional regulator 
MQTWNAEEVQGLISAVDETVREYAPSYIQPEGWTQSIQALNGIERMLVQARTHDVTSSAKQVDKAEQIVWLSDLLHTITHKRYVPQTTDLNHLSLSLRETDVLRWSAAGKTAVEISAILNLKERTVRFHISNAIKKLGAANKTGAVAQAFMCGVL